MIKKTILNFVLTTFLAILFLSVVLYLSVVIATAKFNIAEWKENTRVTNSIILFGFIFICSIISFGYFFEVDNKNNKNKMIKKTIPNFLLTTFLAILFYSVVLYFLGVIASAKFNIAEWKEQVRTTISIVFFVLVIICSITSFSYFFEDMNTSSEPSAKDERRISEE